jgi:hypothetical protein
LLTSFCRYRYIHFHQSSKITNHKEIIKQFKSRFLLVDGSIGSRSGSVQIIPYPWDQAPGPEHWIIEVHKCSYQFSVPINVTFLPFFIDPYAVGNINFGFGGFISSSVVHKTMRFVKYQEVVLHSTIPISCCLSVHVTVQ